MFHRLTAAVLLSTLMLVSASAQTSLPADVARYLERRGSCDHWRGEDGYDAERQAYIKWATCQSCPGSDAGLATLKRKYAENPRVLAALAELEPMIEAPTAAERRAACRGVRKPTPASS